MKHVWTPLLLLLTLCMLAACAHAEYGTPGYDYGDTVADFTVTTTDGETLTLSGMLAEKKAVVLNFWFAACQPCRIEFPFMEQVWQEYKEDIALLAISPYDSEAVIAAYKEELGLTFPMASDTAGLTDLFAVESFPTTIIIDRNGVYCYYECGAMPNAYSFRALFEAYTADDYAAPLLGYVIPAPTPTEPMPASDALATALGSTGVTYAGEDGSWPWLIMEEGVISGNAGMQSTEAVLHMDFTAAAGDALVIEYRVSATAGTDYLLLEQDGVVRKVFTSDRGWQQYAWEIPTDGAQRATLRFSKLSVLASGEDAAMLRSVTLRTGEEAAAALTANPAYPAPLAGSEATLDVADAQEILVDDPYGILTYMIGAPTRYFIVPGEAATLQVRTGPEIDPDAAFLYTSQTGALSFLSQAAIDGDAFVFTGAVNSLTTTGSPISTFFLYPQYNDYATGVSGVMLFANAANADFFLKTYISYATGGAIAGLEWTYAAPAEVAYRLVFVDETGAPLPGVIANVCDDTACLPMVADSNGVVEFTMPGKVYDVHVIAAPEGIGFDPDMGYQTAAEGGEMIITLQRQ